MINIRVRCMRYCSYCFYGAVHEYCVFAGARRGGATEHGGGAERGQRAARRVEGTA